jgi:hypothetical protein
MCSQTEEGETLPIEFGYKLFDLQPVGYYDTDSEFHVTFDQQLTTEVNKYKTTIGERTQTFVMREIELFESWADDNIFPLENDVVSLRRELDSLRRKSRKETNASQKLNLLQQIKHIDTQHKKKYQAFLALQEENERISEELIGRLQTSLKYNVRVEKMFLIKWKLI